MCSQYELNLSARELFKYFGISGPIHSPDEIHETFLPYQKAPVVALDDELAPRLRTMNFSLVPSWSKEPRVKFATHNARLFSYGEDGKTKIPIFEKPTWKKAFRSRHCLVPMSGFVEPIYRGDFAGNMVKFFTKEHALIAAAGIWDEWVNQKTGEIVESFAVLTDDPYDFVKKIGHDRSPVFLGRTAQDAWLRNADEPQAQLDFLLAQEKDVDFDVKIDRPMRPGWEKRAALHA